jgi:hypothetical protein
VKALLRFEFMPAEILKLIQAAYPDVCMIDGPAKVETKTAHDTPTSAFALIVTGKPLPNATEKK